MPVLHVQFEVPSTQHDIIAALQGLVALNLCILRHAKAKGRPVPPIYSAGVHWQPDREKGKPAETWDSILVVRRRGYGDCEDLASWRAAELQLQGIAARAVVVRSSTPGVAWHAVVRLPNGEIEDPSRRLGMLEWKARHSGLGETMGADLARALLAAGAKLQKWGGQVGPKTAAK